MKKEKRKKQNWKVLFLVCFVIFLADIYESRVTQVSKQIETTIARERDQKKYH